ncbi:DNA-binding transcriptional regulator [Leptolyngbya sp. FACHB-261]|uniref:helix-turn-helix domain-containing protein n=1 Tax=Leptolyngbya sp. FACHB-261 TaxID=2692806 RepID=UPI001683F8C3|nr:helix-turn-helix transcriptional regulator [Leptolyngbya sp. FACHB-261]MBD2100535.1 helix-turn-helix transcriptional regulator [Leptolyngbya sp. FACHB-261]
MRKDKRPEENSSPVERLRLERTDLSQVEFAVHCGVPLRTYQRWVLGETEAKLTPIQYKALLRLLQITPEELPDHFGPGSLPQPLPDAEKGAGG